MPVSRRRFPKFAVDIQDVDRSSCTYSFCTLVTDPEMYGRMLASFNERGFDESNSEFLYINNSDGQQFDAYSGINQFLALARGNFIILCHQDLLAIDDEKLLSSRLKELNDIDPMWGLAGNAGFTAGHKRRVRITDLFGSGEATGPFPSRVVTLDENFIVVRAGSQFGCSNDLSGFHMYGPDLVTQASVAGWRSYVIDYHVEHLGLGTTGPSFVACVSAFEDKYRRAFKSRSIKTTVLRTYLGTPSIVDRVRTWNARRHHLGGHKPGQSQVRFMRRFKIFIRELLFGPVYKLDGHKFRIPKDSTYVAKRAIHKGLYEAPERNLVREFLPADLPVIELGGSFGIVSRITRDKIGNDTPMVIVEANPTLMEYCSENATRGIERAPTTFVNAALGYAGDEKLKFTVTYGVHDSRVGDGAASAGDEVIEVEAVSLSDLRKRNNISGQYSLVCDIEGMEFDLLEKEGDALADCVCAIIEFHPHIFRETGRSNEGFFMMIDQLGFEVAKIEANVVAVVRR